jgi:hypothetical protein
MFAQRVISVLKRLGASALVFSVGVIAADAGATPLIYSFDLRVTDLGDLATPQGLEACARDVPYALMCDTRVGDVWPGHFTLLDDSVLSGPDGPVSGSIAHFSVFSPDFIWSEDLPHTGGNSEFCISPSPFVPCNMVEAIHSGQDNLIVQNHMVVAFGLGFQVTGPGDTFGLDFHNDGTWNTTGVGVFGIQEITSCFADNPDVLPPTVPFVTRCAVLDEPPTPLLMFTVIALLIALKARRRPLRSFQMQAPQ